MAGVQLPPITDSDKLRLLLSINRLIASHLELKPLFQEVVGQASRLVSADRSTLWLYDEEADDLYTFLGEGLAEEFRLPLGSGVAGEAARSRQTILTNDAYTSQYFNPEVDLKSGYRTKSLLAVPMESQDGRLLGCFQCINRLDTSQPDGLGEFSPEDVEMLGALAGIAGVAVENALLYAEQKRQFNGFIVTLAESVEARDPTTSNHTRLVTGIAVALAKELGLSTARVERLRISAILHDYGKIGVPDAVLQKPGGLDDDEMAQMRSHVLKTLVILRRIKFSRALQDIPEIAAMHHEKIDGTGYPFGYRGSELPLEARILAVADVFQALTQTRPYKSGLAPAEAFLRCLTMSRPHTDRHGKTSGAHLDGNVVAALGRIVDRTGGVNEHFERESGWDALRAGGLF